MQVEYVGPAISAETREEAWRRIVDGLQAIADSPEVLRAAGAWQFVLQLAQACEDIGQHLTADSFPEAMEKLEAGFGRMRKRAQDAERAAQATAVRSEWAAELTKSKGKQRTKKAFKLDVMSRLSVSDSTVTRWLRGMR